jgi:hypothetical protein
MLAPLDTGYLKKNIFEAPFKIGDTLSLSCAYMSGFSLPWSLTFKTPTSGLIVVPYNNIKVQCKQIMYLHVQGVYGHTQYQKKYQT